MQGKGSRSTYYGRLLPDMYAINTYFNRLGMVAIFTMSKIVFYQRSCKTTIVPGWFYFLGGQTAINTQIGSTVPHFSFSDCERNRKKAIANLLYRFIFRSWRARTRFKWAGWTHWRMILKISSKHIQTMFTKNFMWQHLIMKLFKNSR